MSPTGTGRRWALLGLALGSIAACGPGADSAEPTLITEAAVDLDDDGTPSDRDCDDADNSTSPAAPELCDDGVDNDCDGLTDADDPDCAAPATAGPPPAAAQPPSASAKTAPSSPIRSANSE